MTLGGGRTGYNVCRVEDVRLGQAVGARQGDVPIGADGAALQELDERDGDAVQNDEGDEDGDAAPPRGRLLDPKEHEED